MDGLIDVLQPPYMDGRIVYSNMGYILQCCCVATGSLIHKNENLTGHDGYVFE